MTHLGVRFSGGLIYSGKEKRSDTLTIGTVVAVQFIQEANVNRCTIARIVLTALFAGAGAILGDARDVVEIRLHGRYFVEPATVHIIVAVEPNAENRVLRIEADGDSMYRSSELTLSGIDEKRLHSVEFRNLPAGHYALRAEVRSTNDVRGSASQDLVVTGSGQQ